VSYDAKRGAFECVHCGPGMNRWKYVSGYWNLNEETGDVYCLIHKEHKLGNIQEKYDAQRENCRRTN
jgi:hypothetical protein